MIWTVDKVERLRGLLNDGLSAAQAAVKFGCTRNSIVSVASRKGLPFAASKAPIWTDERIAELRSMALKQADISACARYFGVSQGSIRAIARRSNIVVKPAPSRRGKDRGISFRINHRRAPMLPLRFKAEPSPLPFLAFSIADLEPGHCRWPEGDGRITFCGQQQLDGSSYCEFHHYIANRKTDELPKRFVRFLCAAE